MSAIEPTMTVEQDGFNVRVTQDWTSVLDKMARDIADRIDEATLARLGYVKQETCHIKPWKMEHDTGFYDCMECSECGYVADVSEWSKAIYCAGCGRKVVDE